MDIVAQLGGKEALVHFGIVTMAALVGQIGSYFKKWYNGEIRGNLYDYLVKQHPRRSVATVSAIVGSAAGALLTGQLDPAAINGLVPLITMGTTFGYMANSTINKGADPDAIVLPNKGP